MLDPDLHWNQWGSTTLLATVNENSPPIRGSVQHPTTEDFYYQYLILQAGLPWARPSSGEERDGSGVQEGAGIRPLGDWLRQAGAGCQVRHTYPLCGSGINIPDPNCFHPWSEFFPSRVHIKGFKYFNPKRWFLSTQKYDPGCSSRFRILTFSLIPDPGSRGLKGTGSQIRIRTQVDPILALSGSWQIDKKDVQTERGNNFTSKISNNFHRMFDIRSSQGNFQCYPFLRNRITHRFRMLFIT